MKVTFQTLLGPCGDMPAWATVDIESGECIALTTPAGYSLLEYVHLADLERIEGVEADKAWRGEIEQAREDRAADLHEERMAA